MLVFTNMPKNTILMSSTCSGLDSCWGIVSITHNIHINHKYIVQLQKFESPFRFLVIIDYIFMSRRYGK